jgi:type VI secretion system VasI family protein
MDRGRRRPELEDMLIMTNVRVVALVGMLVAICPGDTVGMPPQDLPGEVKACKAIDDNTERLKCFDALFAGVSEQPKSTDKNQTQQPATEKQANWSIDEKQLADGNQDVVALNFLGDDAVLILRCKNGITEAAYSTNVNWLGYKNIDVELRINEQSPIKQVWNASMNGRAAFSPDAVAFIQSLPDNAKLSIKTTRSTDGRVKEGTFNLGAVSEVRAKIAKACDWADGAAESRDGSDHQEKHD